MGLIAIFWLLMLDGFQRVMRSLERIVALLPWCSSVCLSGTGVTIEC